MFNRYLPNTLTGRGKGWIRNNRSEFRKLSGLERGIIRRNVRINRLKEQRDLLKSVDSQSGNIQNRIETLDYRISINEAKRQNEIDRLKALGTPNDTLTIGEASKNQEILEDNIEEFNNNPNDFSGNVFDAKSLIGQNFTLNVSDSFRTDITRVYSSPDIGLYTSDYILSNYKETNDDEGNAEIKNKVSVSDERYKYWDYVTFIVHNSSSTNPNEMKYSFNLACVPDKLTINSAGISELSRTLGGVISNYNGFEPFNLTVRGMTRSFYHPAVGLNSQLASSTRAWRNFFDFILFMKINAREFVGYQAGNFEGDIDNNLMLKSVRNGDLNYSGDSYLRTTTRNVDNIHMIIYPFEFIGRFGNFNYSRNTPFNIHYGFNFLAYNIRYIHFNDGIDWEDRFDSPMDRKFYNLNAFESNNDSVPNTNDSIRDVDMAQFMTNIEEGGIS